MLGEGPASLTQMNALARSEDRIRQDFDRPTLRLNQIQRNPLGRARADTRQLAQSADQRGDGLGKQGHRLGAECLEASAQAKGSVVRGAQPLNREAYVQTEVGLLHVRPGRLKPAVTLPISALEISFAWLRA